MCQKSGGRVVGIVDISRSLRQSADLLPLPRREQIPRDEVDEGRGGRRLVVPVSPPPAPLLQSRRGAPREGPRPLNDVGPVKISYTLHFSVFSFNKK